MSKHERFTTAINDSTGDLIKTKASNQQAYADNWERIFQKPKDAQPTQNNEGFAFPAQAAYPSGVAVFEEEEPTLLAFTEEPLPSGIIEDEL